MNRKVIVIGVALAVTIIFLAVVLSPGSHIFNLLPYLLHESICKGEAGEGTFIKVFDIVTGGLIFILIYWLFADSIKKKA